MGQFDYKPGKTVIMGVDPSMTSTGFSIFKGEEIIKVGHIPTSSGDLESFRIWVVVSELVDLICEYGVEQLAVEDFYAFYTSSNVSDEDVLLEELKGGRVKKKGKSKHNRSGPNPKSMFLMKAAQVATQMAGLITGCSVTLYKVHEWKGGHSVSKEETRQRVLDIYGYDIANDNITDAIMIGRHHIYFGRLDPDRGIAVEDEELKTLMKLIGGRGFMKQQENRKRGGE